MALAVNLLILGFFKYEGFLADNVNALFGASVIPNFNLSLPIGISFFTLQAVSYIIDVYRREVPPQPNVLYLGMYIAMFPQLIAGPIVRYQTIQDQILNRKENLDDFFAGLRLFIIGLSKKVLLANIVAILAVKILAMNASEIGVVGAWGGLIAYTFQIFFDFSGYSDMAIGLGKMFGFKYLRNFNYPYISKSATEFWRRWHISLSTFFRDYVYIPMGGSRVSNKRWLFNIAVVWSLTGFWHGASWNFILWGVYWGFLLVLEKFFLNKILEKLPILIQHFYAVILFVFGWLIFWVEDLFKMAKFGLALFGKYGITGSSTFWELTVWEYVPVFAICFIACTPVVPYIRARLYAWLDGRQFASQEFWNSDLPYRRVYTTDRLCDAISVPSCKTKVWICELINVLIDLVLLGLLLLSIFSVVSGSYNPFIYFRF